jgi:gamma-glutamyltranspeptidase/glutathione hydrolase
MLLGDAAVERLAAQILEATPVATDRLSPSWHDVEEPGETTHISAVDAEGLVVSLTQSIQSLFGARVVCEPCGFLYNNYLVTCPRKPHAHQIAGRCSPRSNAAPSLMLRAEHSENGPVDLVALGAAGSRRTTSAILHTFSGLVDRGLSLAAAVDAPRFHVRLSRRAWLERAPETEPLRVQLAQRFRQIEMCPRHSYKMGCVQAIQVGPHGMMSGVADPRREGTVCVVLDQSDTKHPD